MKQRIVYLFVFVCCLGLLTSAKHPKNNCTKAAAHIKKEKNDKRNQAAVQVIELSPLFQFVFSI
ncbi:MAG: hypothetical protein EPN92_01030 [Chitinophagaceae bacterium]|nr:MAG: hypothetical protein EPN92_01030 [Chitinophagaceae bacterium]